jgi:CubicO group peptidase (beta-lactamase class C family)
MQTNLQETIQNLLNTLVAEGKQRGAQVAVYLDGKLVVDAWAGVADVRTGAPVTADTLFPVFSTTKGLQATVMHILAERGQIDYDKPIAHYWPEFAANGKESITLRHALSHSSGLPYMPVDIDHPQLCDWDTMCRLMAQQRPAFAPGEKTFYHPVTYGWILGEVARRVDGRHFQPFVEAEISGPLGIEDSMFAGIPADREKDVAYLEEIFEPKPVDPNALPPPPPNPAEQGVSPCMNPLHEWMNRSDARRACIPASNGIMTARAIARHYASLLPGGVDGVEILPPERIRIASELQIPKTGFIEGVTTKALGYGLGDGGIPTSFGHGGYGGSAGYGDVPHRLGVGVTRNQFSHSDLSGLVAKEIRLALGMPA